MLGTLDAPNTTVGGRRRPAQGEFFRGIVSGQRNGIVAILLRAGLGSISYPYGAAVRFRNWLFDHGWKRVHRAAVPVVSIGNLTLGGTGKTPAVEYVARFFQEHEIKPAILSRGYGSKDGHNDEAMVLAENLADVPHWQGRDRVALATAAIVQDQCELLILDDGFQHRRLGRDLDIVLIDATEPWGYGRLFPRGLLREPLTSLLRAGLVILTRCDQVSETELRQVRAGIEKLTRVPIVESIHAPVRLVNSQREEASLSFLAGRSVAAFCGLGNPAGFRRTLEMLGCEVAAFMTFPDHCPYRAGDRERLIRWVEQQPSDVVVTTQKDLVKLSVAELAGRPLWALAVALRITAGKETLDRQLRTVASLREGTHPSRGAR